MGKLTWPRAIVLVLFIAGSVVVFLKARDLGHQRETAAKQAAVVSDSSVVLLPPRAAGVAMLLGESRQAVRTKLGSPAETLSAGDRFDLGVQVFFVYENERATSLIVTVEGGRRNEAALRRWLGLDAAKLQSSRRLEGGWLSEEDEAYRVVIDERDVAASPFAADPRTGSGRVKGFSEQGGGAKPAPGAGRLVRLAAELVRGFPAVPEALRGLCEESSRSGVTQLACRDVVDVPVEYLIAVDGSWSTLTILGPAGTDDKAACRRWLERNVPEAVVVGQRQRDDELQVYFARGPTRYLASYLTLPRPGAGASCSLMACLEDARGNGGACRPR